MTDHLYGLESAEHLYDDPAAVFDNEIAGQYDPMPERIEIIEWSVIPQQDHMPPDIVVAEWIAEWASERGEVDEQWSDHVFDTVRQPDVLAAIDDVLNMIAARNQYRMAGERLRSLWVTFDGDGEPLIDGFPDLGHRLKTQKAARPLRG